MQGYAFKKNEFRNISISPYQGFLSKKLCQQKLSEIKFYFEKSMLEHFQSFSKLKNCT